MSALHFSTRSEARHETLAVVQTLPMPYVPPVFTRSPAPRMPMRTSNRVLADGAHGYEAMAREFMSYRTESAIGAATVRQWATRLPRGGAVLDLGCGHGIPISTTLVGQGLAVFGIDASATLLAAFRARFPDAPAEHSAVEESPFFHRQFDGVIAWGLIFLLSEDAQVTVIQKVAAALRPGGRFLFTAPRQECAWRDTLTGQTSRSLGGDAYRRLVAAAGLELDDETDDEGQNHYFSVRRSEAGDPIR